MRTQYSLNRYLAPVLACLTLAAAMPAMASPISDKYAALGGANGKLGAPTTAETICPDGVGHFRHYAGGSIYWSPATNAHEIQGEIRNHWANMGWEKSFLGYPTTDETTTPDSIGRFNHFQGGSIYWKPTIGAHEVHGLIRSAWASKGWETNADLGYPISDETKTANGIDRYSDFENGVLFWKSGAASASQLSKLTLGNASQPVSEVFDAIKALIVPLVTGTVDGRQLYINSGPSLLGPEPIGTPGIGNPVTFVRPVSDYWINWGSVRNRMYKVRTNFGITVDGTYDPTVTLDLWIEVFYDKASRTVFATPRFVWLNTEVQWPTSLGISAAEINTKIEAVIGPEMNKLHNVGTIPNGIDPLSIKVMPNGDLNVYIAPIF